MDLAIYRSRNSPTDFADEAFFMVGNSAVILSGISSGLGSAFFDELISRGARLYAIGRSFTPLQMDHAKTKPGSVILRKVDLAYSEQLPDAKELTHFLSNAYEAVLIHNAATIAPIGAIGSLDSEDIALTVRVNLLSTMILTNAFVSAVKVTQPHRIRVLFITTGVAQRGIDGLSIYGSTKAGAEMFFRFLSDQTRGEGRWEVHCLKPGAMDTPMLRQACAVPDDIYFPQRDYYAALLNSEVLPSPAYIARRMLAYVLAE